MQRVGSYRSIQHDRGAKARRERARGPHLPHAQPAPQSRGRTPRRARQGTRGSWPSQTGRRSSRPPQRQCAGRSPWSTAPACGPWRLRRMRQRRRRARGARAPPTSPPSDTTLSRQCRRGGARSAGPGAWWAAAAWLERECETAGGNLPINVRACVCECAPTRSAHTIV